jgi:hypothetical protein
MSKANPPLNEISPQAVYTVNEALRFLRICRQTLYSCINSGQLKSLKLRDKRLFRGHHLLEFLDNAESRAA